MEEEQNTPNQVHFSAKALDTTSTWYSTLRPLLLDLVGDFAGQELFFIDGDSLCLHVFQDPRIEIKDGPQVVHAIYVLEKFLSNLKRRGCNFHLVFFENRKLICFNHQDVKPQRAWRYILIREAFVRHLQQTLSDTNPVKIYRFQGTEDCAFDEYLDNEKPYFCMAHDAVSRSEDLRAQHFLQTGFLMHMMKRGYNVALLDKVEFRDSKVMTLVTEGHHLNIFTEKFQKRCYKETSMLLHMLAVKYGYTGPEKDIQSDDFGKSVITAALSAVAVENQRNRSLVEEFGFAFLQHHVLLSTLKLEQRCVPDVQIDKVESRKVDRFINMLCRQMAFKIANISSNQEPKSLNADFKACDAIDVRLFKFNLASPTLDEHTIKETERLVQVFEDQTGIKLTPPSDDLSGYEIIQSLQADVPRTSVLPFQHSTFDSHLSIVKLEVDGADAPEETALHRLSKEKTHWHSQRLLKEDFKAFNMWQHRSEQIQRALMQKYAASLTGRTGKALDPELIILDDAHGKGKQVLPPKLAAEHNSNANESSVTGSSSSSGKNSQSAKKGKAKPGSQAGVKKADLIRAANTKTKTEKTDIKTNTLWERILDELVTALQKAKDRSKVEFEEAALTALARVNYFQNTKLKGEESSYTYLETRLLRLKILVDLWARACAKKEMNNHQNLAALILEESRHMLCSPSLSKNIFALVRETWSKMGFGPLPPTTANGKESLTPKLDIKVVNPEMKVALSPIEFQLTYSGPYMDRSFGSAPDLRVRFDPDEWQRHVLDLIDANKSVFVVAPTSAGKTFISFYAMEKVLRGSNDGILVYVAPTKALVNQIAAEVIARFDKSYPHAGQTVWGIHTRDYRINKPDQCQILITVPHILQIMLLSPANANKWAPRVKRIIFDEIHSIGQAEDGVVWEQLLLLAPCPIIALSATVGNPDEFKDWLVETQKAVGYDLEMVEHKYRYSDLRKFHYHPSPTPFRGLQEKSRFGELDNEECFMPINPIATLIDIKHRGIPNDLSLEPRDCLELYNAMEKHQNKTYQVSRSLNPLKWFQGIVKKVDVVRWEAELKRELEGWMSYPNSPFEQVLQELSHSKATNKFVGLVGVSGTESHGQNVQINEVPEDDSHDNDASIQETTLSLIACLDRKDALPAILFTFDRMMVGRTAVTILRQLEEAEKEFKKTNPGYLRELEQYEQYKKSMKENRPSKRVQKPTKSDKKSKGNRDDDIDDLKNARLEEQSKEPSKWESFDPEAPHERFTFAGKVNHDVEEDLENLRRARVPEVFISCLRRGVGLHHAGLSRRLRESTETLFRMGYLRVVIATGTLALGINMPCKTVAFIGDSVYLTALSYRQCAGRAGRRGFDVFGNVVFHGLSKAKVDRIISSRLPSLNGHFPISTSLVLRLFSLLTGSEESPYSNQAINQLLSQPRLYMGGDSFKEQVLHHLRFSIEYLRRQQLIDGKGKAINLASLVGHLYYTGNSAFAFHALLQEGVFHNICENVDRMPDKTCRTLMMVMAQLFGRRRCKSPEEVGALRRDVIRRSSSEVYLPPMPKIVHEALVKHNEDTLKVFTCYVTTFANEYCRDIPDNTLPFTDKAIGKASAVDPNVQIHARSTFYRLSGHGDNFESVEDLANSTRHGVFLESNAIPIIDTEYSYYNAYLLDFYKHGSEAPLVVANGLRKNDVWFLLNNFSMILATVVTALANFLSEKVQGGPGENILDILALEEGEVFDTDEGHESESEGDSDTDEEGDLELFHLRHAALADPDQMLNVLKAFTMLKRRFDEKLKAIGSTKRPEKPGQKTRKPKLRW